MSESKIWVYIGKIGVLVAIIWGVIQIINFFVKAPEYNADITSKHTFYETSPWHFETIRKNIEYKAMLFMMNKKNFLFNNLDLDSLLDSYKDKKNIKDNYEFDLILNQMNEQINRDYNTIWVFNIKNTGGKSLEDLILEFPYIGFCKVFMPDNISKSDYFDKKIKIGDLRPSNETKIYCWTNHDKPITKEEESNIRFTHKNGLCEVTYPLEVSGIYAWFNRNNGYFILFLIVVIIICNVFYSLGKRMERKKQQIV